MHKRTLPQDESPSSLAAERLPQVTGVESTLGKISDICSFYQHIIKIEHELNQVRGFSTTEFRKHLCMLMPEQVADLRFVSEDRVSYIRETYEEKIEDSLKRESLRLIEFLKEIDFKKEVFPPKSKQVSGIKEALSVLVSDARRLESGATIDKLSASIIRLNDLYTKYKIQRGLQDIPEKSSQYQNVSNINLLLRARKLGLSFKSYQELTSTGSRFEVLATLLRNSGLPEELAVKRMDSASSNRSQDFDKKWVEMLATYQDTLSPLERRVGFLSVERVTHGDVHTNIEINEKILSKLRAREDWPLQLSIQAASEIGEKLIKGQAELSGYARTISGLVIQSACLEYAGNLIKSGQASQGHLDIQYVEKAEDSIVATFTSEEFSSVMELLKRHKLFRGSTDINSIKLRSRLATGGEKFHAWNNFMGFVANYERTIENPIEVITNQTDGIKDSESKMLSSKDYERALQRLMKSLRQGRVLCEGLDDEKSKHIFYSHIGLVAKDLEKLGISPREGSDKATETIGQLREWIQIVRQDRDKKAHFQDDSLIYKLLTEKLLGEQK